LRFTEFELRQLEALGKDLDAEYQPLSPIRQAIPASSFQQIRALTRAAPGLRPQCVADRLADARDRAPDFSDRMIVIALRTRGPSAKPETSDPYS
jgi:hypothetical protein